MTNFLHLIGSYPLLIGLLSQVIVLVSSLRSKDKTAALQGAILMGAMATITASLLLRPKSPPSLVADLIAVAGAVFLLTPGVQALLKLRQKKSAEKAD